MESLYLDQHALNFITQLILTLWMMLYLLSLKKKSTATWYFVLFFTSMSAYAGSSIVEATSLWRWHFYAVHGQVVFAALALLALLQFAYRFPWVPGQAAVLPGQQREATLLLGLSLLLTGGAVGWALYQFMKLVPGGNPTTNTRFADIGLALGSLWVIRTFWRRAVALSHQQRPGGIGWHHWFWPQGRAAQGAFAFALISLLAVVLTGTIALYTVSTLVPERIKATIPSLGVLLLLFGIAITFFSYTSEATSVMAKLSAISLVTMLLVLGGVGAIVESVYLSSFQRDPLDISPRTFRFEPTKDGNYRVTTLPSQFDPEFGVPRASGQQSLPFAFPFYGEPWQQFYLDERGQVVFGEWYPQAIAYNLRPTINALLSIRSAKHQTFVKAAEDSYRITWQLEENRPGSTPTVVQAVLYPDGAVELNYQTIHLSSIRSVGIQSGNGGPQLEPFDLTQPYAQQRLPTDGLLTNYDLLRRQFLHAHMLPLLHLILGASLFIVLGFPLFFYLVLVKPLHGLVAGVQAVERRELQVRVPLQSRDELGVVTQSFNNMVEAVYLADQRLEGQVAERTRELAESEARFRGLAASTFEAVLIHEQGRIRDVNEATLSLFGHERNDLVGRPLTAMFTPESGPLVISFWQGTGAETLELSALTQDGAQIPVEVQGRESPYSEQGYASRVMVVRDLTERRQIEAQRQRLAVLEERERIGRELHDDLGQVMGYVIVQVQAAQTLLREQHIPQLQAVLGQLGEVAQEAHDDVRQYILGIRTASPTPLDFRAALEQYLAQLQQRYGLMAVVNWPEDLARSGLVPEVETQLLRIIQEALTNIRKHAGVARARLLFTAHSDTIQVVIADEGKGFDCQRTQGAHFGLEIMRERAEVVDGSIVIHSAPGQGTEVIVRVPRLLERDAGEKVRGLRVLLVDDHPLYLEGLRNMLRARGVQVVGAAQDGLEAQKLAETLRPDLILMDVEMPRCNGLEATRCIKAKFPEMKIVMLTVAAEDETLFEALKEGASGYLLKSLIPTKFFALLADVMAGETALSPALAARVLEEFAHPKPAPEAEEAADFAAAFAELTERQREVLGLLVQGASNKEIAATLYLTEATVKHHVGQILKRLQLRNRYDLTHYIRAQGLHLPLDPAPPPS